MTNDLQLTRTIDAPVERVWQALTVPAVLVRWFWPATFQTKAEVDPYPGGVFRISSPGRMAVHGRYTEADRPRLLAFTWQWAGEEPVTTVRLNLSSVDTSGTELALRHDGFPDAASRDDHVTGWSDCLARLAGLGWAV